MEEMKRLVKQVHRVLVDVRILCCIFKGVTCGRCSHSFEGYDAPAPMGRDFGANSSEIAESEKPEHEGTMAGVTKAGLRGTCRNDFGVVAGNGRMQVIEHSKN